MNTNQNFSIFKTTQRERSSSTYCINPQRFLKGGSKFFLILLFTIMGLQFSFAQDYFIYVNGQKRVYDVSNTKLLIKSEVIDTTTIKNLVQTTFANSVKKVHKLPNNLTMVDLQNVTKENLMTLRNQWNAREDMTYVSPVLLNGAGKEIGGFTNQILIRLKNAADYPLLAKSIESFQIKDVKQSEFDERSYTLTLTNGAIKNAMQTANELHEMGLFEYSEPNLIHFIELATSDPYFTNQWGLKHVGQYVGTQYQGIDIRAEQAWTITTGSPNIKVAVLDVGVELNHPDLVNNLLPGYDATGNNNGGAPIGAQLYAPGTDAHGTVCAGIVAAQANNNIGTAGVAYNCKILPIRIALTSMGWATTESDWIIKGINWAWQNGVDVLSMSFSCDAMGSTISVNTAISNAVTLGRNNKGCVLTACSHNQNANSVTYPAKNPNVIAVGAISPCGERKSPSSCDGENWGSNYGPELDIVAPGVLISTTDRIGIYGYNPNITNGGNLITSDYSDQDYTVWFNGTSAATPHVAGVAALILSVDPNLTRQQVRNIIESTAQKVRPDLYTYSNTSGRPNGTWHQEMGYGLVDAYAAVVAALHCVTVQVATSNIIGTVTWNTPKRATTNITIQNGATLTISSVLLLENNVSITVKPGGKLIVNGGILTNGCNNNFWGGIIVEGNTSLAQTAQNQGTVELLNNAIIENAEIAISNKNTSNQCSGAIITGKNSTLRNNNQHLYYGNYDNGTSNLTTFTNCNFLLDNNYANKNLTTSIATIRLDNLRTITFKSCNIKNTSGHSNAMGIHAINAGFSIKTNSNLCIVGCITCSGTPSVISGFAHGIMSSTTGNQFSILIVDSRFENNSYGFVINSISNSCQIAANIFENNSKMGMFLYHTTGYKVEGNKVYGTGAGIGIRVLESGIANNLIYRNEISNSVYGLYITGNNGINSGGVASGLQFTCNKFNNCNYNIFIDDNTTTHPWQGTSTEGADNIFNTANNTHLYSMNQYFLLAYFHSGIANNSNVKYPANRFGQYNLVPNTGTNSCTSKLCNDPLIPWIIFDPIFPIGPLAPPAPNPYSDIQDEYDNLMSEYSTKNFDAIVKQVDNGNKTIPQNLANRATFLRNRIHELGNKMAEISDNSITHILSDSVVDFGQLKAWYNIVRTPAAKYSLAETFYQEGNYAVADQVLSTIPEQFNYGKNENHEHTNYMRFHALKNTLAADGRLWSELSEKEINDLRFIRETTKGRSSAMANGVLCFYYQDCKEIELPNFEGEIKSKSFAEPENSEFGIEESTTLYVYPNPTSGLVEILSLNQEVTVVNCEVLNITGNKLLEIKGNESTLNLDLSNLENGTYFVRVTLSNQSVEMIKIVKL